MTPDLFPEQDVTTQRQEEIVVNSPPLSLPIDELEFLQIVEQKISESKKHQTDKLNLDERRIRNNNFWLGKHFDESDFYSWQVPYVDNLIFRNTEKRISLAAGRMPDIIATPPNDTPDKRESARQIERFLDGKLNKETTKRMVKDGLRDEELDFIGAIKFWWDKNKGENGDFCYGLVRPERLILDHTGNIPHEGFTAENLEFIAEWIEEPLAVVLDTFPEKEKEIIQAVGSTPEGKKRHQMTKIRYKEIWFTWYSTDGQVYKGVGWIYQSVVMGIKKNPYWDWDGYEKVVQDETGGLNVQTFYRNHLEKPSHPYILISYRNLRHGPFSDTTTVEQGIPLQRTINKRGRQITEINDAAVPKLAFAGQYITKEEARRITHDPNEHIWLDQADDINKAVQAFSAAPPNPILYQDLIGNRSELDALFSTQATTRGQAVPNESGVSKQITREGDLVDSDDIVSVVVERIIYEMANWSLQLMKLFYKEPHYIKRLGKDGEVTFLALSRDDIDDGVEVDVRASSVDKQMRQNLALQLESQKAIDPMTLYEDMDAPNPKERTERMLAFTMGQGDTGDGFATYREKVGIPQPAMQTPPEQPVSPEQLGPDMAGVPAMPPASPQDLASVL